MKLNPNAWPLRAVFFAHFGCSGLLVTYFPLYFDAVGLSASLIGVLFAVKTVLGAVAQPALAMLADRIGHPRRILTSALSIGLASAFLMLRADSFGEVAFALWLASPFLAAMVPLLDALTVSEIGVERYGSMRSWGSVGFGIMVAGFGLAVANLQPATAGERAIHVYAVAIAVGVLATLLLRPPRGAVTARRDLRAFRPGGAFVPFLIANGLHWAAVNVFNVFLSLHASAEGLATWVPGVAQGVAIVGEVAAFLLAARLHLEGRAAGWFAVVVAVGVVRWCVTALAPSSAVVIAVQLAHFVSFGVWFSIAMRMLGRFAAPERRGTVQGVFAAACFGGGGMLGALAGGFAMDEFGSAAAFYTAAAFEVAALIVFVATWSRMPERAADSTAR